MTASSPQRIPLSRSPGSAGRRIGPNLGTGASYPSMHTAWTFANFPPI